MLGLKEVAEYADSCLDGSVPNTEGLRFVIDTSRREVGRDPGVRHLAGELDLVLDRLRVDSPRSVPRDANDELRQLIRRAEDEYCSAWERASGDVPLEFRSRAMASHLLDSGFSEFHLHRWLRAVRQGVQTMADLNRAVSEMFASMPMQPFDVFVPCAAPFNKIASSDGIVRWLSGSEASSWLGEHVPKHESRRHNGGFLMTLTERDPWSAVETARGLIGRMNARVKVATPSNQEVTVAGWARVAGNQHDFDIRQAPRHVEIGSLVRMEAVYRFDLGLSAPVDDALELASYMEESPSVGAAITGGWSAVESLLIRPGERSHHLAADRLASLICCSLPRAELTELAYRHADNGNDRLAAEIGASELNRQKVALVEEHLSSGGTLALDNAADEAAQARILAMIASPHEELERVRGYVTESLRRLYNQRNTITHAGNLQSVALRATIRTALSLVAAGLDRIVHAQLETAGQVTPLDLQARAETELRLLGSDGARSLSALLE